MKKITAITIAVALYITLCGWVQAENWDDNNWSALMIECAMVGDTTKGQWAEAERNAKIDRLGLSNAKVSYDELRMLSQIVNQESGSYWLSDEHQRLVASVVLNRMASPEFPDTMYEVLTAPGQYGGTIWQRQTRPSERAVRNALYVLENGSQAPAGVIFQSNFSWLGSGVWKAIPDRYLATTYFGYSYRPWLYEEAP